jgi:hypothetical protein
LRRICFEVREWPLLPDEVAPVVPTDALEIARVSRSR